MAVVDIERLSNILREAAKAEILPRFRRLDAGQIHTKTSAIDLVTEADTEAEKFIAAEVLKLAPNALFVGEESVAADPVLLFRLADADLAIVVDPVDGTANFAGDLPLFAVMAAVVSKGETVAGLIYDPMGDDWVMAEKGAGSWRRRPDGVSVRLHVAEPLPLAEMVGCASVAYMPPEARAEVLRNLDKVRMVSNYRCAGHEYSTFVAGHTQFCCYNKLMPWDHLPGVLISQEAGAYAKRLDGSDYLPSHIDGGLLVTTSKDGWDELRAKVFTF
jgi:fructose-1,6-bisphosphatase/inositol monophosphatase family enzyme